MTKHRLELFSDGVFAIVLTLLVLDLRTPQALGVAGLREAIPALLVHAATFAVVGLMWVSHHNAFAAVEEVRADGLVLNLFALFWLTLMPFAAKVAAAHPLDPLGPSTLAACYGSYTLGLVAARLRLRGPHDDTAAGREILRRVSRFIGALGAVRLVFAGLAWLSPWWGYAALGTVVGNILVGPSLEAARRMLPEPKPTKSAAGE
jgi:uncharacterized membrane protein